MKSLICLTTCLAALLIACGRGNSNRPGLTNEQLARATELYESQSILATPPSRVFVPDPPTQERIPLSVTGARRIDVNGKEVEVIELRGWLRDKSLNCGDPDFHYELELDPEWMDTLSANAFSSPTQKFDLNTIIPPGSMLLNETDKIVIEGDDQANRINEGSRYVRIGLPVVHVELNGWLTSSPPPLPSDWQPTPTPNGCDHGEEIRFPFNPLRPLAWQSEDLAVGQYVRMVGSLLTEQPHFLDSSTAPSWLTVHTNNLEQIKLNDVRRCWGGDYWLAAHVQWENGRPALREGGWLGGLQQNDQRHPARWTEMHPPDFVAWLQPASQEKHKETVRVIAMCSENGVAPTQLRSQEIDLDIFPPAGSKPGSGTPQVQFIESISEVSDMSTVTKTVDAKDDRVHVHIKVSGQNTPQGKRGKFAAVYRVFWKS